jgi:membrane-associated protein
MTLGGYYLGSIPIIRLNFEKAVIGIVVLSVAPLVFQYFKARRATS